MTLSEAARKNRNAYYRAWRKKNPDKARAIQERYWQKKTMEGFNFEQQAEGESGRTGDTGDSEPARRSAAE